MYRRFLFLFLAISSTSVSASAVDDALTQFSANQNLSFSAQRGQSLWNQKHVSTANGKQRYCPACHGADLTQSGRHLRSGKTIAPMAPSANPERFSKLKKINKWFKRNCKWTLGRECTNQEKGDILSYLSQL